jgi:hypothetical protein
MKISKHASEKGIGGFPVKVLIVLIIMLLFIFLIAWFAYNTQDFSKEERGQMMDKFKGLFGAEEWSPSEEEDESVCGDGTCQSSETWKSCWEDCKSDEACKEVCDEHASFSWNIEDDTACLHNSMCYCERPSFGACQSDQNKPCISQCSEGVFDACSLEGDPDCHDNCLRVIKHTSGGWKNVDC